MSVASFVCPQWVDDSFGPNVLGCRGDFDLSLLFEQSIMTIGPALVLLLFSPVRLRQLIGQSTKTQRHWLLTGKQVISEPRALESRIC